MKSSAALLGFACLIAGSLLGEFLAFYLQQPIPSKGCAIWIAKDVNIDGIEIDEVKAASGMDLKGRTLVCVEGIHHVN